MKNRFATTSKYGFIVVVFLVLVLICLFFFTSSYNKNATALNSTVNNLSHNHTDRIKIDSAMELLYIAENNARMYALYNDKKYYADYIQQLKSVGLLIDSLSENSNDDNLAALVEDKQIKTQLFLKARLMMDSLLVKAPLPNFEPLQYITHTLPPLETSNVSVDTAQTSQATPGKKKKGLFRRLGDALRNQQDTGISVKDKILISKYERDSVKMQYEKQVLRLQVSDLSDRQKLLDDLKLRERNMLEVNHRLFSSLQGLLRQLDKTEAQAERIRSSALSKDAFSLSDKLARNHRYATLFSILLAAIILAVLFSLYKNELKLNKAKIEAENYARLKSEFTATMSHEIRTPLHSINAFANELNLQDDKQKQSEVIDAIKLSSGMLLSVANNILDYTKIERGKFQLASTPFNPKEVIQEILAGIKIQAAQKKLELIGNIDESADREALGDAFQLRQILLNIIGNAIKYTDKGSIQVSARLSPAADDKAVLHIRIADTGAGISNKDLAQLFDEFSSNEHRSDIVAGSFGLGLSIVKKMVDLHHGKISVNSEMNKGTTFIIELPYTINHQAAPAQNSLPANKSAEKDLNILLIENDAFNQKLLLQILNKKFTQTATASDAQQAIAKTNSGKFDLILTDYDLPDMNAAQMIRQIKTAGNQNNNIPVFCLTGFQKEDVGNNAAAFDEWLVKPFKSEELFEKINKYF